MVANRDGGGIVPLEKQDWKHLGATNIGMGAFSVCTNLALVYPHLRPLAGRRVEFRAESPKWDSLG
jgi:hypothetical protein